MNPRSAGKRFQSSIVNLQSSISLRAFAKINLGLRVLSNRADGYHEIRTVYQTVALHDRLEVSLPRGGRGIHVECDHPDVPSGHANLVYRACELWRRAVKFHGGISVRLEKTIPAGSGLGGASSDAAAALLGLEYLTDEELDPWQRLRLAARLGSDVPLYLWGGRVLGLGRGAEVYPLDDLPHRYCLVVFPGFSVSTAQAYRELDTMLGAPVVPQSAEAAGLRRHWSRHKAATTMRTSAPRGARLSLTKGAAARKLTSFGLWPHLSLENWGPAENDFEKVVFAKWPELARLKRQLLRAGAEAASLTGSGSAVYALFVSARQLTEAQKLIPARWRVFRTRTLARAEYWEKLTVESRELGSCSRLSTLDF